MNARLSSIPSSHSQSRTKSVLRRLSRAKALRFCGTLCFLLTVMGCRGSDAPPVSHGGPVQDHVSLVDTLRTQGFTVEPTGPVTQPFFPVPGQTLHVEGQDIQVFEFSDADAAKSQAEEISPDGMTVGQTAVQWVHPPHFFTAGKIIVLYVGTDRKFLNQIKTVLGEPITQHVP